MRLRTLTVGVVIAAAVAVAVAQPSKHAPPPPAADDPVPGSTVPPSFFNHLHHSTMANAPVNMTAGKENCATCHHVDEQSKIEVPGAHGHQPCLSSGCHDTWFIAAGVKTDPKHDLAVAFCLGCHETTDGGAPVTWQMHRPVFRSFKAEVEWSVEMPGPKDPVTQGRGSHFKHVDEKNPRQDCRSCHIVNEKSGLLEEGTPGHLQCAVCHNPTARDGDAKNAAVPDDRKIRITMSDCGGCHHAKPANAVAARVSDPTGPTGRHDDGIKHDDKHVSSVRSCGSEGHEALAAVVKRPKSTVPCFRHETPVHRYGSKTSTSTPVECGQCHHMVARQAEWPKIKTKSGLAAEYYTLADIRANPIVANDENNGHLSCGSTTVGCHKDTFDARQCEHCHESKSAF